MASVSERLALIIDFKGDSAIKGLEGVAKKSESAHESSRKLSDGLTKMGAAGLAGAGVAALGLGKLASGASDLNETLSKSRVIFGAAAKQVEAFGDTAAKSLGMSKQAAVDAASTFGTFGKAAGLTGTELAGFSTKLVGLAGDLASFSNTSPEEAIQALGAALRGEAEPIRRYGVLLDDATLKQQALDLGLIKSTTGTLPPAIKVQAAYAAILKQTGDAQGDFARTADEAANQQRILKASLKDLADGIGTGVLPMFTGVVKGAASVVGALNEMSPAAKSALGSLAAGGTGVVAAVSGISLIAGQLVKLKDRFTSVEDGVTSLNLAGKVAAGAAVGIGLFATVTAAMAADAAEARARVDELRQVMKETGDTAGKAAARQVLEFAAAHREASAAMERAGVTTEQLTEALGGNDKARGDLLRKLEGEYFAAQRNSTVNFDYLRGLSQIISELRRRGDAVSTATRQDEAKAAAAAKMAESERAASLTVEQASLAARAVAVETAKAADETKTLNERQALQADLAKEAAEREQNLADAITGVWEATQSSLDPTFAYHEALRNVADDADDLAEKTRAAADATKKHGAASVEAAKAGREVQAAQEKLAKDIQTASLRLLEQNGTVAGSRQAYDQQIAKIQELRKTYGAELGPIGAMLDELERKLNRAATSAANLATNARIVGAGGAGYGVGARADGGPVRAGQPYIVGEEGPELMVPDASGVVVPNDRLRAATSGAPFGAAAPLGNAVAPVVVNVYALKADAQVGQAIVDSITAYERRNGKGWRGAA